MFLKKGLNIILRLKNNRQKSTYIHWSSSLDNMTRVGSSTYIGKRVTITKATIGNFCSIANNVSIGQGEHDYTNYTTSTIFTKNPFDELTQKHCEICNDVWIGTGAVIRRGVTVSDGAVIGANAVVTKDVPAYAIAVGVPAKVIKYRFDDAKIAELLESQWWNYKSEKLKMFNFKHNKMVRNENMRNPELKK
jgi:virginiamycin A acetyltransferase